MILGHHLLLELYDCSVESIDCIDSVRKLLHSAANKARATIVETTLHKFSPQGVSGVVIIAESHIAIHTWPEHRYVAIDCFSCGEKALLDRLETYLRVAFQAKASQAQVLARGLSKPTAPTGVETS